MICLQMIVVAAARKNYLKKLKTIKNILHAIATRHGEYDFGSYKRGFQYARDKKILNNYKEKILAIKNKKNN